MQIKMIRKRQRKPGNHVRNSKNSLQTREAQTLLDQANIPHDTVCGIEEYKKIQAVLAPDYLIKVHSQHPKDGMVFYSTIQETEEYKSDSSLLEWRQPLRSVSLKSKRLLGCSYYCEYCDKGYTNRGDHPCPDGCKACYSDIPCITEQKIKCVDCHRIFRSQSCFNNHKFIKSNQKKSICQLVYSCEKCSGRIIGNKKNHVCPGERKCKFCKEIVGPNHQCYIQKYEKNKKCSESEDEQSQEEEESETSAPKFVFYDFESTQETGEHHVNFCVAQRACDYCIDLPSDEYCPGCSPLPGGREMIFKGPDTLSDFCTWVLGDDNKGVTCIAHNFGGYDGQFILRYILEHGTMKPDVIMNGNTIMRMTVGKVTFLDSYLFLHMRLANFPKTFGLTEMKKGYFPHLANTQDQSELCRTILSKRNVPSRTNVRKRQSRL